MSYLVQHRIGQYSTDSTGTLEKTKQKKDTSYIQLFLTYNPFSCRVRVFSVISITPMLCHEGGRQGIHRSNCRSNIPMSPAGTSRVLWIDLPVGVRSHSIVASNAQEGRPTSYITLLLPAAFAECRQQRHFEPRYQCPRMPFLHMRALDSIALMAPSPFLLMKLQPTTTTCWSLGEREPNTASLPPVAEQADEVKLVTSVPGLQPSSTVLISTLVNNQAFWGKPRSQPQVSRKRQCKVDLYVATATAAWQVSGERNSCVSRLL